MMLQLFSTAETQSMHHILGCVVALVRQLGSTRVAMLRRVRGFNVNSILSGTSRSNWLDVIYRSIRRIAKEANGYHRSDAILVPIMEHGRIVWRKLDELEELEVVGQHRDWDLEWKSAPCEQRYRSTLLA